MSTSGIAFDLVYFEDLVRETYLKMKCIEMAMVSEWEVLLRVIRSNHFRVGFDFRAPRCDASATRLLPP